MSNGTAPIVFISYSHDSLAHKAKVRGFAAFLQHRIGLDVKLDQWDDNVRRDWSLWATDQMRKANFVIVVASPEYRKRADGGAEAHEGRGAQFEAAMLRDSMTKDLGAATRRILPVVLPGGSIDDIPVFLNAYSTTRFEISEVTRNGVAELIAAITGVGEWPMPERGEWLGGTGGTGSSRSVPAANGPGWRVHGAGIQRGDALIDRVRYVDSIVLRSAPGDAFAAVDIDLGGVYQRFTAMVGVLDDARERFQVPQFRVSVDGAPLAEYWAAFGKPRAVDVSVVGGMTLRLETYRANGSADLAWGEPTLS